VSAIVVLAESFLEGFGLLQATTAKAKNKLMRKELFI
jgi:hypothetical protein